VNLRSLRSSPVRSRRGGALVASLLVAFVLSGVLASMMLVGAAHKGEVSSAMRDSQALYLADAGVTASLLAIGGSVDAGGMGPAVPAAVGTPGAPRALKGGTYWSNLANNGDGTWTVTSTGKAGLRQRTVMAIVQGPEPDVFDHAIFAGNSSNDAGYTLQLGGLAGEADEVEGNIYSGGDVAVEGDATVSGDIHATGAISGLPGEEGKTHPIPDIAGMDYAKNNDVDVAAQFAAATWDSNALGGSAWQVPESDPAHIFRKNPSDRTEETSGTVKDDYFLEDPYQPVESFKSGHTVVLTSDGADPALDGTDKLYYVDGNLWVHNFDVLSIKLVHEDGVRVTFVVKGDIYFSDNVLLEDVETEGVAFIAIKDEAEKDSGNIYFGDPRFGTLEEMHTFLYAENNFVDNNLDAAGSKTVTLTGNMTAGNLVDIQRDFVNADGTISHSKLTVDFDPRISDGSLVLPGLPTGGGSATGASLVFWRELGGS
jgi:hypothetical protein